MIYLFWGDDTKNKLSSYEKFIKSIPTGTETFFVSQNNFDRAQIESFYSGAGLFFSKCVVVLSNIFEREETQDFILEKLQLMGQSDSSFIFLEGKLNKSILNAFKKARTELNTFLLSKEKRELFDNFLVANAFGVKDKLNLWIYFRQAMDKGVGMEELIGVLFWKIKDMMIKSPPERSESSGRAGISSKKFSKSELEDLACKLSYLLPQARKAGLDAESVFERFLLEAF